MCQFAKRLVHTVKINVRSDKTKTHQPGDGPLVGACERELYKGTAPEQKTENAKNPTDSMSVGFFIH